MTNNQFISLKNIPSSTWITSILISGSILRILGFSTGSLWNDEAYGNTMTRLGLFEMVRALRVDINPPTWDIILWFVVRLLGRNEFSARIVSVLASIAILWVVFLLAKEFALSPIQQIGALAVLACLPYQLWIAQDSKIYAVFNLLFLLSIYFIIKNRWIGLVAIIGLLLWCHNTAILYLPALIVFALLRHPKSWSSIILAFSIGIISWLPWASIVYQQAQITIPWFLPFSRLVFGVSFMTALFAWGLPVFGYAFAITVVLASISWGCLEGIVVWILYRMRSELKMGRSFLNLMKQRISVHYRISKQSFTQQDCRWHLALLIVVPLSCFAIMSIFIQNVFIYRTISPVTIPLMLWLAIVIIPQNLTIVHRILLVGWICVVLISLVGWSPAIKSGNFFHVFEIINSQLQEGDVIYHSAGTTALLFWYYLPEVNHYLLNDELIAQVDVEISGVNIQKAALEEIPYRRAWIVWSLTPVQRIVNGRVYSRMAHYTENCRFIAKIQNPQIWPSEVFLCERWKNYTQPSIPDKRR